MAWATVTEAQPKRRMGRAGKLNINIDNVRLTSGEKVALRAVKDVKGAASGCNNRGDCRNKHRVFPAAPLFLLVHGKDITIPKGTEITAYTNGDIPLDPKKFVTQTATSSPREQWRRTVSQPLTEHPRQVQRSGPAVSTVDSSPR